MMYVSSSLYEGQQQHPYSDFLLNFFFLSNFDGLLFLNPILYYFQHILKIVIYPWHPFKMYQLVKLSKEILKFFFMFQKRKNKKKSFCRCRNKHILEFITFLNQTTYIHVVFNLFQPLNVCTFSCQSQNRFDRSEKQQSHDIKI